MRQLADIEREADMSVSEDATAPGRFARLLAALHRHAGRRVVVLVDEYDKPILDALGEPALAKANRDDLRGLYGMIKACDAHVELTFLTGVSLFSKVSLFSDLNNLTDLTPDRRYSGVCGYTEADLDTVFAPELPGLDRDTIRAWYNGYNWRGSERVYNPFEFKVAERATGGSALAQLKARGYADKYRAPGVAVHLIGVELSAEQRAIVAFDVEAARASGET